MAAEGVIADRLCPWAAGILAGMAMFAHVDGNSFYCSCERAFNPRLAGKPVVVLSNNDGCLIALTPEAKALGLKMGTPYHLARDLIREHGVEAFSSNYTLYGDMSRRLMETLAQHAPAVEVYSIDEAFLRLDGMAAADLEAYARDLRDTVRQWTGIPVGVGVGASKTLAKVANRAAKKSGGVCVLDHASDAGRTLLDSWPMGEVWGIAGRLAARLARLDIHTAGALARTDRRVLRKQFGVVIERMALELGGVSCLELEEVAPPKQNICCSRSFGRPTGDLEELRQAVATHAARAGEKLRRQRLAASSVHVFLCTNRHRPEQPQYFPQAGRELLVPTAFTPELVGEATTIVAGIYRPGHDYIKAGVLCLDLVPDGEQQGSLLRPKTREDNQRERRLMAAVDALNLHYGRGTVRPATAGFDQFWRMRQSRLSPRYTTCLRDVPHARL